ncbi:MAG: SH3 domain-containing protein [Candidatus Zixiibacteriota bacterium]
MLKKIVIIVIFSINICIAKTGLILWDDLYLRKGPGTSYPVVKVFHEGKYFKILEYTSSTWIKANANGYTGYFRRSAIKEVPTQKYTIKNPVTFKWGPTDDYPDLAHNSGNIVVEVVWSEGDAHFGQYNGSGVWFDKDALSGPWTDSQLDSLNNKPDPGPIPAKHPVYSNEYRGRNPIGGHLGFYYTSGGSNVPAIEVADGYQQLYWTLGGMAGLRWSFNRSRSIGLLFRLKGVYIPKDYKSRFYYQDYDVKQRQIILDATLGMEFDFGYYFSIAAGAGYAGMQDYLSYGLTSEEDMTKLNDEIIYGPIGYLELNTGLPHFRIMGGVDYYYWQTDRAKFDIRPDGSAMVDENIFEKHLIRGYAGVMVLF